MRGKKVINLLMALGLVFILSSLLVASVGCDTEEEIEVMEVPCPWQTWEIIDGNVRGTVSLSEDYAEAMVVEREWAILPQTVELDDLTWANIDALVEESETETSVLWAVGTWSGGWTTLPPVTIEPGAEVSVDIPLPVVEVETGVAAVLRYTAALASDPDDIVAGFVNAVPIQLKIGQPQTVGPLSLLRVHNNWNDGVNNFELVFSGLKADDITKFYGSGSPFKQNENWGMTWYGGWGVNPTTGNASVIEKPDGTLQIVWKDTENTIKVCEWVYFGIEIKPDKTFPPPTLSWTKSK